jgi:hypothetical protein
MKEADSLLRQPPDLTAWANETLKSKSGIEPVPFSDSDFKLKQFGIALSSMNEVDSITAKVISEKLNLDFILFTKIGYLKENFEQTSSNYDFKAPSSGQEHYGGANFCSRGAACL